MLLVEYYNSLNENEKTALIQRSQAIHFANKRRKKEYKISKNALIIAARIKKDLNLACYPITQKVKKEWWESDTKTFRWSINLLTNDDKNQKLFSYMSPFAFKRNKNKLCTYSYKKKTVIDIS